MTRSIPRDMSTALSNTSSGEHAAPYSEKDKIDGAARVDDAGLKRRKRHTLGNTATIFASVSGTPSC